MTEPSQWPAVQRHALRLVQRLHRHGRTDLACRIDGMVGELAEILRHGMNDIAWRYWDRKLVELDELMDEAIASVRKRGR